MMRMYAFYSYSQWDDIVYPGIVIERILHGLKYNVSLESQSHPSILPRTIVKTASNHLFLIHVVAIIIIFIFGLFSFGIWPEAMKESLFHVDTKHEFGEMEKLSNKNDQSKKKSEKILRGITIKSTKSDLLWKI